MFLSKQIQDVLEPPKKHLVRMSHDFILITIGDFQMENLDWKFVYPDLHLNTVLEYNPHDWRSRTMPQEGVFQVTKYGLSGKSSLRSYSPLWQLGTPAQKQSEIMFDEMEKMKKNGAKKCESGVEITEENPLWDTIDSLATKCRQSFMYQLKQRAIKLGDAGIKYDVETLWNSGVNITPDIIILLHALKYQISK